MSKADGLAHCRAGLATEEIISMLSAITGRMRADDPVCEVLDKANDALMDHQEAARIEDARGRVGAGPFRTVGA